MPKTADRKQVDWGAVASSARHPTRQAILEFMETCEGPVSPNEMHMVGIDTLGNSSYHVRVLTETGEVELVHTEQRRGTVEHYYVISEQAPFARLKELVAVVRSVVDGDADVDDLAKALDRLEGNGAKGSRE